MPFVVCALSPAHIFILQSASGPHFLPFPCHFPHPQFSLQMTTGVIFSEDHLEHSSVLFRGFSRLPIVKTRYRLHQAVKAFSSPVLPGLLFLLLSNEPSAPAKRVSFPLQTALSLPVVSPS